MASAIDNILKDRKHPYLWNAELFWVEQQPFLESQGYQLRLRYKPGWEKSWSGERANWNVEDGISPTVSYLDPCIEDTVTMLISPEAASIEAHGRHSHIRRVRGYSEAHQSNQREGRS